MKNYLEYLKTYIKTERFLASLVKKVSSFLYLLRINFCFLPTTSLLVAHRHYACMPRPRSSSRRQNQPISIANRLFHRPLKGFTLVELMIVIAIVGTLFSVGGPILNQVTKNIIMSRTRTELQTEARSVIYLITRNVRQAKNSSITISRYNSSQPYYSKVTFTKNNGQILSFYQNGKDLIMKIGTSGAERILSKNLRYLAFIFPESSDMEIFSISLTLEKNIYEGKTKALHMASEKVMIMNQ